MNNLGLREVAKNFKVEQLVADYGKVESISG